MESPDALKRIVGQQLNDEMLDALDQLFPERTPELSDSIDQIRYAAGQRSVIRFLRGLTSGSSDGLGVML
jgi:hypothetical protein